MTSRIRTLLAEADAKAQDPSGGGWSYGHVQHGHICAGAGGLNSMPVMAI